MWYTCSIYEGTNSNGKLLFSRKVNFKADNIGVNHKNLEAKFINKYREHIRAGYLLMTDDKGSGIGFLISGPNKYWYIKYKGQPIKIDRHGGFSIGEWDGWLCGIGDVTRFPRKQYAVDNLKILRQHKTVEEQKRFKLVKVTIK